LFIGVCIPGENAVKTLSLCHKGKLIDNITYNLEGTPCDRAFRDGNGLYFEKVCQRFPKDSLLQEMSIEGYIGVPLHDSEKNNLGIMVALFRNKIENGKSKESLIQFFASRAETELERTNIEMSLKKSEEMWRSLVANVPGYITVIDCNYCIKYLNRVDKGYTVNDFIGRKVTDTMTSETAALAIQAYKKVIETKKPQIYENKYNEKGKPRWFNNLVGPIQINNKIESLIIVSTDITKQKENEMKLSEYHKNLEKLVNKRTEELLQKNVELEEKNKELLHYNELFVGREFRIKELRDEIKRLKNE